MIIVLVSTILFSVTADCLGLFYSIDSTRELNIEFNYYKIWHY